ncbi:hypothetical protein THAOC_30281 [Thalassiosira oceanica]|uniref:Uncharacterized protein n=1 Tax=Thalassiosira oceanica TaxID=159749 RepID=K0RBY0_THAOC|nr:hypothetical protein THAOC_30281 [Thalassiosira oceanica]|eukprot:EJK50680.1 hypothetical protein THAOC_30281 [Thalassiosira oceanica]
MRRGYENPDLPVIPEVVTPKESEDGSRAEEVFEDDDDAHSSAASYAFTLDNVGFDEEASIVSMGMGLFAGAPSRDSLSSGSPGGTLHVTPPPRESSPRTISKHERGLMAGFDLTSSPSSSSNSSGTQASHSLRSDSSSDENTHRNSTSSSFMGSLSLSDSDHELRSTPSREGSPSRSWPWPTRANSPEASPMSSSVPSHQMEPTTPKDDVENASLVATIATRASRAKEKTSTFTSRMKESVVRFLEAYDSAGKERTGSYEPPCDVTRAPETNTVTKVSDLFRPGWFEAFKQPVSPDNSATPLSRRLTLGAALLFGVFFVVAISAMVATTGSEDIQPEAQTVTFEDGIRHQDPGTYYEAHFGDKEIDLEKVKDTTIENLKAEIATVSPSNSPTKSPTPGPTARIEVPSGTLNDCVDSPLKHVSSNGKAKRCNWLSNQSDVDGIFSGRQDVECGAFGQATELGLMCRHSCRGYNGCLPLEMEVDSDDEVSIETARPTLEPDAVHAQEEPVFQEEPAVQEEDKPSTTTFVDMRGKERGCQWLDIRHMEQRDFRRETNCDRLQVQVICPESCAEYMTVALYSEEVEKQLLTPAVLRSAVVPGMDVTTTVPMSDCHDENGLFLNHRGKLKQCNWLIKSDPTDESRRITNCPYEGIQDGSELGRMCTKTCGGC